MKNINSPTSQIQHEHQQKLREMYRQNYQERHPEELREALFDYLTFLDLSVTGKNWGAYTSDEFSIFELEALTQYQENILRILLAKNCIPA